MFRKRSGSILCPSCGGLTSVDAPVCVLCGRRNPGMWGFAPLLRHVTAGLDFTRAVTAVCVVLYLVSLALDPGGALRPRGFFGILSPTGRSLDLLGMTGAIPWADGRWWTLFTAIYLHGGLFHILFNLLWIRELGPPVEELYGPSRLVVIFTVSGVVGFMVSNMIGVPFTIGASGSIFGLLGAMVAYGRRRGGVFGARVLQQYGRWAIVLFVFGFFMSGVNNFAHAGGFAGGFGSGLLLASSEQRERGFDHLLGLGAIGLTIMSFALAFWNGFVSS